MADRRESMLAAAKTALEVASVTWHSEATTKPTGLSVHRHLGRQMDKSQLPALVVRYFGEQPTPQNQAPTDVSERNVTLAVECRAVADADESGDEALIPVMGWAEIAILSDDTLGGVTAKIDAPRIDAIDTAEFADVYAAVLMQFPVTLHTKWGDPRSAP